MGYLHFIRVLRSIRGRGYRSQHPNSYQIMITIALNAPASQEWSRTAKMRAHNHSESFTSIPVYCTSASPMSCHDLRVRVGGARPCKPHPDCSSGACVVYMQLQGILGWLADELLNPVPRMRKHCFEIQIYAFVWR